jgi:dTDP-4-amino-4,6-dideoxygalactose transaminase
MPDTRLRYPFARPAVPPPGTWLGYLEASYEQRWFSNGGPLVRQLERRLAQRTPGAARTSAAAASATSGLVGTLLALGVRGPVALPSFTFPASAHAIELAGCIPVLCDVDPVTWELSCEAAATAVRNHDCVAIMHVRPFGLCRDLGAVEHVAASTGVPLIVDSAAAFGGRTAAGVPVGGAGHAEVFSFHATKVFAAGEGGAVFAAPQLTERIERSMNFSLAGGEVGARGLNGKMSELTAAVALAMLDRLDEHVARRRAAVERLLAAARASGMPFETPAQPGAPPWQGLPLLIRTASMRERALRELHRAGVEARAYYTPSLHRTRAWRQNAAEPLPVSEELSDRMLCLPVYSDLEPAELDELAGIVCDALAIATEAEAHGVSRS